MYGPKFLLHGLLQTQPLLQPQQQRARAVGLDDRRRGLPPEGASGRHPDRGEDPAESDAEVRSQNFRKEV